MGGGLHMKDTSPEEAFMVQREERRRSGDSFRWLDLKGGERHRLKNEDVPHFSLSGPLWYHRLWVMEEGLRGTLDAPGVTLII